MTTTLDTDLEVFATSVRRELHDLGPDVIDELTDGLEADLADSLADGGSLGDPVAYAAELRAAAGLNPRGRHPRTSDLDAAAKAALAEIRGEATRFVARHPSIRGVIDFFVSLRPVWWLLRAWALFAILNAPYPLSGVPDTALEWMLLAAFALFSVQWGRGRWLPWRWSRGAIIVVSAVCLLLLPVVAGTTANLLSQHDDVYVEPSYGEGIVLDGEHVTNIFAYGPDGQLLTDVRLFNQDGDPLSVVPESWGAQLNQEYSSSGVEEIYVPSDKVAGSDGWNVYPLATVTPSSIDSESGTLQDWANRVTPHGPFSSVQQLLDYEAPAADPTE